jgi:GGDEF domain-containing protein
MVAVDGLTGMLGKGGFALKQVAMRSAYEALKTVARERECFGMSLLSGDRIMAVFPSTSPARLAEFGHALCAYARANPIVYTGTYKEDPPAKARTASAPGAASEANAPSEMDPAEEFHFDDAAPDRLRSREPLPEGTKADGERARRKPGEPVRVPLSLSLGASHNLLAETSSSFEGLVEKAGRALSTAREANGDRYVMWREAESEIAGLRDDLAAQSQRFRQEEAVLREEASEVGGLQQAALVDRIQAIFAKVPRTPDLETVEKEIIALAVEELYEGRKKAVEAQMAEHKRLVLLGR